MAETQRKYKGSITLGQLELELEAHEALFGELKALEALLGHTVATYDDSDYPPGSTLALMPSISGVAPPAASGTGHMFDGEATILTVPLAMSVYRTS